MSSRKRFASPNRKLRFSPAFCWVMMLVFQSLQEAFRITGTSHILAISGYHGTQTIFNRHTIQPDVLTIAFHYIQGSSFVWGLFLLVETWSRI